MSNLGLMLAMIFMLFVVSMGIATNYKQRDLAMRMCQINNSFDTCYQALNR